LWHLGNRNALESLGLFNVSSSLLAHRTVPSYPTFFALPVFTRKRDVFVSPAYHSLSPPLRIIVGINYALAKYLLNE
jgi:hypothetical protein